MKLKYSKRLNEADVDGFYTLTEPEFRDMYGSSRDPLFISVHKYHGLSKLSRKLVEDLADEFNNAGLESQVSSDTDLVVHSPQLFVAHLDVSTRHRSGHNNHVYDIAEYTNVTTRKIGEIEKKSLFGSKRYDHISDIPYLDVSGTIWYDNPEDVDTKATIGALTTLGYNVTPRPFSEQAINALSDLKHTRGSSSGRISNSSSSSSGDGGLITGIALGVIGASLFD